MRSGHIKPSSEGILTAQDALPEETLVSQLMDQVANRVVSEIRKPHDSTPEF